MVERIILVVNTNDEERSKLVEQLSATENVKAYGVRTPSECIEFVSSNFVDSLVIDSNFPDQSGIEATKALRDMYFSKPIFLLYDSFNDSEYIKTLENGANDIVKRPVHLELLNWRIIASLRHFNYVMKEGGGWSDEARHIVGRFAFDPGSDLLMDNWGNLYHVADVKYFDYEPPGILSMIKASIAMTFQKLRGYAVHRLNQFLDR